MKKVSLILGMLIVFAAVVCFLSTSAFAGKAADWPYGAAGGIKYQVIDGSIAAIDYERDCFFIVESEILDVEPLYLGSQTMLYEGTKETCLADIRSVRQFTEADILSLNTLEVGDWIEATFSIIDGKYVAENICLMK